MTTDQDRTSSPGVGEVNEAARGAGVVRSDAMRRTLAFRLDDTLKNYYPEDIEKRRTVCFHLADDIIDMLSEGGV